jgi:hypothetical protein
MLPSNGIAMTGIGYTRPFEAARGVGPLSWSKPIFEPKVSS